MKVYFLAGKSVFLFAGAMLVFGFLPFVWISAHTETLYVDKDASGSANGTKAHPYKEISDALDHAKDGDMVLVAKGTYKESIKVPKGVSVRSENGKQESVTIDGGNDKPTVTMGHGSTLSSVTVKDGSYGVVAKEDANIHLYDVLVRDARHDGIYLESAPRDKQHRAFIDKVEVKNSGRAGIYSEKRFVNIVSSTIHDNGSDGIDFRAGVKAWLEDDKVYENKASGWKLTLDGSEIWTDGNDFRRNGREGVEIESFGAAGNVGIKKSKEVDNGRHGVVIVARNTSALSMWKNIFLDRNSAFGNKLTQVSSVLLVK